MKKTRSKAYGQGSALIIVLGFVALLTILVLAFLSKSLLTRQIFNARAGQTQVDFMSDSAVEFMKADLRQEIVSGSTNNPAVYSANNSSGNSVPIYVPSTNATSVPSRTGFTPGTPATADPYANVIKISKYQTNFFSGPPTTTYYNTATYPSPNFASQSSTGDASLNGRYIDNSSTGWTTTGWDKPQLIDTAAYTSPNPLTSIPLPDWIYVTTAGRKLLSQPDSTVIGRYAFVVYDEGGLLDINVAGYPSSLSSPDARDPSRKGALALADLTQLPGSINATMKDNLVAWRNSATTSSFSSSSYSYPTTTAPSFLKYILNGSLNGGFTRIYPGDQKFLSRQELLAYSAAYPTILPPQSMAYLATFTRALNAPTWTPATTPANTPGCTVDYTQYAENPSSTSPWPYNVDSANIRWPADVTITRPKLDEDVAPSATTVTTETITFHKGDAVIQHRFPLSKIALLSNPNAQTQSAATQGSIAWAVNYYFGLQWVATDTTLPEPHWEYVHEKNGGTLTSAGTAGININSIPDVAILKTREPDFFEILRQSILRGSAHDIMILDIGASIIDQFDADDEPTAITNDPSGSSRLVFGKENLPYFSQMLLWPYRPNSDTTGSTFEAYLVPMFWNPHCNASTVSPAINNFQIIMSPGIAGPTTATISDGTVPHTYVTAPGVTSQATLSFSTSGSSTYQEPTILMGGITSPSGGTAINDLLAPFKRSGFYLGSIGAADKNVAIAKGGTGTGLPSLTKANVTLTGTGLNQPPKYVVQCQHPDGSWQTYESFTLSTGDPGTTFDWWTKDSAGANSANAVPSFLPTAINNATNYYGLISSGPVDPRISGGSSVGIAGTQLFSPASIGTSGTGGTWRSTGSTGSYLQSKVTASFGIFSNGLATMAAPPANDGYLGLWSENNAQTKMNYANSYYMDHDYISNLGGAPVIGDNVQRPGDGTYGAFPMTADPTGTGHIKDRPILLNRPFRSVGELGYAYRGVEWRTIDFCSAVSGDAGLLDMFSIGESQKLTGPSTGQTSVPLTAGVVSANTRHPEVLQALLAGSLENDLDTSAASVISTTQANTIANAIVAETSSTSSGHGPLVNRSEIVTRLMNLPAVTGALTGTVSKPQREAVVRALAEPADTRTWNLLIDLVVQAGRYPPPAITTGTVAALSQFDVLGERRYWLHLAIDRYTGKVIDEQLEVVHDN